MVLRRRAALERGDKGILAGMMLAFVGEVRGSLETFHTGF